MKGVVHLSGNSPLMMQKMWVKGCLDDGEVRYVLMPILKIWVKGCLDEAGGDWEKRRVICVDYGVWGA